MKKLLFICLLLPIIGFGQTYRITGMSISSYGNSAPKIYRVNETVVVTDSTFSILYKGETKYNIVKKVDSSYFKCTDGLKDYLIKISNKKFGRYSGFIREESDNTTVVMWFE